MILDNCKINIYYKLLIVTITKSIFVYFFLHQYAKEKNKLEV